MGMEGYLLYTVDYFLEFRIFVCFIITYIYKG